MLTALILICSAAVTPKIQDCNRDDAMTVMRLPTEFRSPTACLMEGQAYLANTSIGRELGGIDRIKIVCARSETIDASTPLLTE